MLETHEYNNGPAYTEDCEAGLGQAPVSFFLPNENKQKTDAPAKLLLEPRRYPLL